MITSTLSSLPGNRAYEAVGVVIGIAFGRPSSTPQEDAFRQMKTQARSMGADAIIDVRLQVVNVNPLGGLVVAVIGTAIKFT